MTDAPEERQPGAPSTDEDAHPDEVPAAGPGPATELEKQPSAGSETPQQDGSGDVPADADPAAAALAEVTQQRDTYLDHLRRERAEFENFRRRSQRERTQARDRGAEALISQLLGVLDNFGYVLEAAKDSDDAVAKGVRMVHGELREILERAGLEDVPGVDAPFDPTWHDAVMQVEGETTDDGEPKVAQVLRSGYRFKGRVLRPASVAVTQ
ncbi:MAG TPA: nucleotide exchange factor GrpE [Euzebyales bacterium]